MPVHFSEFRYLNGGSKRIFNDGPHPVEVVVQTEELGDGVQQIVEAGDMIVVEESGNVLLKVRSIHPTETSDVQIEGAC